MLRKLIELLTGEPLAPNESPSRMLALALAGLAGVYLALVLVMH